MTSMQKFRLGLVTAAFLAASGLVSAQGNSVEEYCAADYEFGMKIDGFDTLCKDRADGFLVSVPFTCPRDVVLQGDEMPSCYPADPEEWVPYSNTITITGTCTEGELKTASFTSSDANIAYFSIKAGQGDFVSMPDPALPTGDLIPGNKSAISHVAFCWNTIDFFGDCWEDETAWAAGVRYVTRGNWATYTPYVAGHSAILYAGQDYDAGTVTFSAVDAGQVIITVSLNDGFRFDPDTMESLKIQGYASAPSGNPAPGGFANKADCSASPCSIEVPAANFYGVHVDVERAVECVAP